jgi:hypothetical protein
MLVEPSVVSVKLYRRDERGMGHSERCDAPDEGIDMPEIGASLSLVEIYDILKPRRQPRLRRIGPAEASKPR